MEKEHGPIHRAEAESPLVKVFYTFSGHKQMLTNMVG